MMATDPIIFKITTLGEWANAEVAGRFNGSAVDIRDGYIHFSTALQVRETLEKHFCGLDGLVLIAVDADELGQALNYEPARAGALFPHLHGPLLLSAVLWVKPLVLRADGSHVIPDLQVAR